MKIAVYCGANAGNIAEIRQATVAMGHWIAERGNELIYGGGGAGLMGLLATSVLEAGGRVIGIIPTFLKARELAYDGLTELIVVESMSARKEQMIALSDVCIALPGGAGTLEEINGAFSWARIGQNANPCIYFNPGDYWAPEREMYDRMVKDDFLSQSDREKLLFSDSFDEIEAFIAACRPPEARRY